MHPISTFSRASVIHRRQRGLKSAPTGNRTRTAGLGSPSPTIGPPAREMSMIYYIQIIDAIILIVTITSHADTHKEYLDYDSQ